LEGAAADDDDGSAIGRIVGMNFDEGLV